MAAAIIAWAMLRRIRPSCVSTAASTGSAEMPSAVPMKSAKTVRCAAVADERIGHDEAHAETEGDRDQQAADRHARGGAAEPAHQREVGLEAGDDQQQQHAEPGDAAEQAALQRVGREEPVRRRPGARWPSTEGPSSRPAVSSPITGG